MKQSDMFLQGEGDAFYTRNRDKPRLPDPVIDAIEKCGIKPKTVLELGCGNGWRLAEINRLYKPQHCAGYDPSELAVKEKVFKNLYAWTALGALERIRDAFYELVIFGFCLYLVDREDLMMIVGHADRVLKDGGHIIIHDFSDGPYRVPYKHKDEVWSYHMDYSLLWLGHPAYYVLGAYDPDENNSIRILKKDLANAWPERTQ